MKTKRVKGKTHVSNHCVLAAMGAMGLLTGSAALSAQPGCVELKTTAETEQEYVNEQGQKTTRLVPAGKVVPGNDVVWTVTAKNICNTPASDIVIANPVPEQMSYVADSAMGIGSDITYSIDGKEFKPAAALTVREADGTVRSVRPDEYRHIRWMFKTPFAPGATAFVRYRAIVK
jgi:uncharacterized repeat protein (TIGR01451 family)